MQNQIDELKKICPKVSAATEAGLTYYLLEGLALGAMGHFGFPFSEKTDPRGSPREKPQAVQMAMVSLCRAVFARRARFPGRKAAEGRVHPILLYVRCRPTVAGSGTGDFSAVQEAAAVAQYIFSLSRSEGTSPTTDRPPIHFAPLKKSKFSPYICQSYEALVMKA